MDEQDSKFLTRTDIQYNWVCPFCSKDLNDTIRSLGRDAYDFHILIHSKHEVMRLRAGLEMLRDGGYGCRDEAQAILDGGGHSETGYDYCEVAGIEILPTKEKKDCKCPNGSLCEFFEKNSEVCLYGDI